jgi:hypothetical protein
MSIWMKLACALGAIGGLGMPVIAHAETLTVSGVVAGVASAGADQYAFRAYLRDGETDVLTGCNDGFAYMNEGDPDFQVNRQRLLDVYFGDTRVRLSIDKDAVGWCRITEILPSA